MAQDIIARALASSGGGGGSTGGGKTELVYNGTKITKKGADVTFKQIVDLLKVSPDFTYLNWNNRAYLPTVIDDTSTLKYICFESSMIDNGMSKNATITVYSNDGVGIVSITNTNVANENFNNKVSEITDVNKISTNLYPSVKAVVDYTDKMIVETTEAEYEAMKTAGTLDPKTLYVIPEEA